jgi:2-aminoethylphosphonate-pyruvate transaminase
MNLSKKENKSQKDAISLKNNENIKFVPQHVLLSPGPVLMSTEVKNASIRHEVCHRDEEFEHLMTSIEKNFIQIFKADNSYSVIFITGSATSGLEAAITSSVIEHKKTLIISNGSFGERLKEILELYRIPNIHLNYSWGKIVSTEEVEEILESHEDIATILMIHNETSVGLLNPISKIGEFAKKYDKLFIIDAVSSLGAEDIDVKRDNIDICISSANKCLHSMPGITIICISAKAKKIIENSKPMSYYLNLKRYLSYSLEKKQTPFTPATNLLFSLYQASQELLEEGLDTRQKKYKHYNSIFKEELAKLGFEFFTNSGYESHATLIIKIPEDINFTDFYNNVKECGFIIYKCKSHLENKFFQIANMGEITEDMIFYFIMEVVPLLVEIH